MRVLGFTSAPILASHMSPEITRRSFLQSATVAAMSRPLSERLWEPPSRSRNEAVLGSVDTLTQLSLAEATKLVRTGKMSPAELTQACLARIEQLNPALNCFITVMRESALKQARTAETEILRGRWRGPLHGIPIALKDLFDTAGVKTTAGSALFKDRVPSQDAEVVRKLKVAGAVLIGKTNLTEFARGGNTVNSHFGAVRNPWDLAHVAGGSSGGTAAAVAAQLCYAALGTDTAGSIRQPASFCGIVGLKPTFGLVSTRGVIPVSWSCDHVGMCTRTVEDNALILQAIAGYDPSDAGSVQMNVPDYRKAVGPGDRTSRLRVGVPRAFFFSDLDADVDTALRNALAVLRKITKSVEDVVLPSAPEKQDAFRNAVLSAESFAFHHEWVNETPNLYLPETLSRLRTGAEVTALRYIQARRDLEQARRQIAQVFDTVDVLVTPTTPSAPPTIAESTTDVSTSLRLYSMHSRNTLPFNVYGIPTISVPCGFTSTGLPIGLQMSARSGADLTLFQLAYAYERATEWHKSRPAAVSL